MSKSTKNTNSNINTSNPLNILPPSKYTADISSSIPSSLTPKQITILNIYNQLKKQIRCTKNNKFKMDESNKNIEENKGKDFEENDENTRSEYRTLSRRKERKVLSDNTNKQMKDSAQPKESNKKISKTLILDNKTKRRSNNLSISINIENLHEHVINSSMSNELTTIKTLNFKENGHTILTKDYNKCLDKNSLLIHNENKLPEIYSETINSNHSYTKPDLSKVLYFKYFDHDIQSSPINISSNVNASPIVPAPIISVCTSPLSSSSLKNEDQIENVNFGSHSNIESSYFYKNTTLALIASSPRFNLLSKPDQKNTYSSPLSTNKSFANLSTSDTNSSNLRHNRLYMGSIYETHNSIPSDVESTPSSHGQYLPLTFKFEAPVTSRRILN